MRRLPHLWVPLAVVLVWAVACRSGQSDSMPPDALIRLPGADDVSFDVYEGRHRLSYTLHVEYPASEVLRTVRAQLEAMGWRPLRYNYFMPAVATSHVTGWDRFDDVVDGLHLTVHAWSADWTNAAGDVVLYGLKYAYPRNGRPDLSQVQVFAVFFPRSVAEALANAPRGELSD